MSDGPHICPLCSSELERLPNNLMFRCSRCGIEYSDYMMARYELAILEALRSVTKSLKESIKRDLENPKTNLSPSSLAGAEEE